MFRLLGVFGLVVVFLLMSGKGHGKPGKRITALLNQRGLRSLTSFAATSDQSTNSPLRTSVRPVLFSTDVTAGYKEYLAFTEPKPPAVIKVKRHQSIALTCEAQSQFGPAPVVTWMKNGLPVQQTQRSSSLSDMVFVSATKSVLYLDCISEMDTNAVYTCVAESNMERIRTDTKLVLRGTLSDSHAHRLMKRGIQTCRDTAGGKAPRIVMWSPTTTQEPGRNATLFCRANGVPNPVTTWELHHGCGRCSVRVLANSERHTVMPNGDLIIRDLNFDDDMGTYVCKVENSNGVDRVEAFLYPTYL